MIHQQLSREPGPIHSFEVAIELDKIRDIGFHQFVTKQLSLQDTEEALRISIAVTYRSEKPESTVVVTARGHAANRIEKSLKALQLERGKHYLPIGLNAAGKRNIEGLLPDAVTTAVYGGNADLVQAATSGTKEEQESAKGRLKKLLLAEFKERARPGEEFFGKFYALAKTINRVLA